MAAPLAAQSDPKSEFECPWEPPGLILEAPDPYFKAIWEDQASILSKRVHSIPFHAHHSFPKSKLLLLFLFFVDTLLFGLWWQHWRRLGSEAGPPIGLGGIREA